MEQQWKATERLKQFSLRVTQDLYVLPEWHSLVADRKLCMLLLVNWQDEQVLGICDALSDEQFSLVLTLLEQWPSYVPYECLLTQLGIPLTTQDIEDLEHLRTSGREDEPEEEQARARVRPVLQTLRDLLSECKLSLHDLGIDIGAVKDYGPLLTRDVATARHFRRSAPGRRKRDAFTIRERG